MKKNQTGAYTQGEWKAEVGIETEKLYVHEPFTNLKIALIPYDGFSRKREEAIANAKLIAASPKMLNALIAGESELKVFVEENEENEGARIALRFMQVAIAEATKI